MKQSIFKQRVGILRKEMAGTKADTLWIIQPENRRYVSGFKAVDTQLNESSGSLIINPENALLVTDSRYTIEAIKDARDFEVVTLKKGLVEEIPAILARLKTKVLGFEGGYVSWDLQRKMAKKLRAFSPAIRMLPMDGLIEGMREVKDRAEIRMMERSAVMMGEILDQVIAKLQPGRTEKDIARQIEELAYASGADGLAFPSIVASGPNGALPHAVPSKRKIRASEPIVFDVGIRLQGYCCDMTRTVFLGRPTPKFKEIYHVVRKAQLAAIRAVRPGMKSSQLDGVAREIIQNAGFGEFFGHSLGHGVGLATHEGPRISPLQSVRLEEGMVFTIEPGIYIPGKGGVRLEEMVVVGKHRARLLTRAGHIYDFSQ
ncbi:MAG: aminopeptidase P family protein [Deltaproteobacteria bacterium]|nr:aminopeptidase P family protein [Deltaproteobacteria bacterium]